MKFQSLHSSNSCLMNHSPHPAPSTTSMEAKPKRRNLTFLKARGHFWGINCSSKQEPCRATPRHNGGRRVVPPVCTDGKNLMQVRGRHRRGQAGWREPATALIPSLLAGGGQGPPVLLCPEDIPSCCPVLFQACLSSCPEGGGGRA